MNILFIDDNKDLVDSIKLGFEAKGIPLTGAVSAEEALELMKKQIFDIIITDYKMPGIDGIEFLRRIQDLPNRPIRVLISGFGNNEVVRQARNAGTDTFISKPFTDRTVEEALLHLLEEREFANYIIL